MSGKKANVQRPTLNVQRLTKKLSRAALERALAARTSGVTYRDRRIVALEKKLVSLQKDIQIAACFNRELLMEVELLRGPQEALELLDDCVGKLRAKAKANCGTSLGYALTYLDEARPYVAHDALGRMNGSHSATRHHD